VERNLDIQHKSDELELSTKYKSEFLANMSHELRTPLNSILLLSRLLSENNEKNLNPEEVESAKVIQSSGNGLLSLIDEILDLSKIEAGKMDLEYARVHIAEIQEDMRSLFAPIAKDKNLELMMHIAPDVPLAVETDKMRLEQVLKNLLSNALKFTKKGSVSLKINLLPENPSFLKFSVTDTGIGIPADKQALIFEAFQQADGSTRRKFGGTGLGLSISRELAKLLGGEIKVHSEPGHGSEFSIVIPVVPGMARLIMKEMNKEDEREHEREKERSSERNKYTVSLIPEEIPDDRSNIIPGNRIVLIIEDDTNFAVALLSYTRKRGYKGLVAVRGDAGIEMAHLYKPVAILLDLQLPVKDGWAVMEELKANIATRHIPVHIMSSVEAKRESLLSGAVDFINKPVAMEQMQDIFRKLEEALSRSPKKVLIVEENPKHAKALAYFLETFHINAEIKDSVKDSISTLQNKDVDCVILDMGIPAGSAYETLETVKKSPGLEHLPIIIFTGKNLSRAEESRIKKYADSIVVKTAHSYQRILDEISLFLHLVEENNSETKDQKNAARLGALDDVLKNKTVLVADDDVRNIFSLTKALEQHKMKVISATDGKEALQAMKENPNVDVVLMDMMMPEMDGYESIKRIRMEPGFKDLPILAVTAKAMMGDREKCIEAGASDYISKPVDIDQLLSLLRVWLYDKAI
jgi:CheY-like chemotaxis protein/nitrogen-specific signal transduction histidine kinase